MIKIRRLISCTVLYLSLALTINAQEEARLLRFPDINGDQMVFCYGGDLYSVSSSGGMARKLTTHIGYEMFPHFSPDGKYIAFTGQYDGNTEVFLIPSQGGIPKRLTYTATLSRDDIGDRMGPNNIVMGWTPDGKEIIYRSRKQSYNDFRGQLFLVPVEGGVSRELPITDGGFCSFSPDGSRLAFNWVFREFRTWKYYKGGMADDIRILDLKSSKVDIVTNTDAQEIIPMWIGDEIFFLSDRDRTMNLFVYDTKSKTTARVTDYTDYDIKFPGFSNDYIVFEKGGYLYKFNVKSRKSEKLAIQIADDRIYARNEMKDAGKSITNADLSPNGERIVLSARGEIFNVPSKTGFTVNLTGTSGAHEREAAWSPDGKTIAYLSDQSGEYEIYTIRQDGSEKPVQVTSGNNTYIFGFKWSPDSKKIIYNDKRNRLQIVDIESKKITLVEETDRGPFYSFNWSPDSKWIVYVKPEKDFRKVRLYNIDTKVKSELTDSWYDSSEPVFSRDGKYILFTSSRDFNPVYSNIEWNHVYINMDRIYLITLSKDTPNPFAAENDIVKNEAEAKPAAAAEKTVTDVKIDLDGIQERIAALPVNPSNYGNLECLQDKVYYNENMTGGTGLKAKFFDLKKKKETDLGDNLRFTISSNGKKMLVRQGQRFSVIDLPSARVTIEEPVDLAEMKVYTNLREEWAQMFNESWRHMRDFFYAPNMHGVDWKAMYEKYKVLVPYVAHRSDLAYLMGEMVAELNIGHAYVNNGERPMPERINTGLLGAQLSRDRSGYYRIDKIMKGANWSSTLRSPLREIGVNVNEGDFILAVDGRPTSSMTDIYESLINKAGKEVELTVSPRPAPEGSRKVLVKPIDNESSLYYYNWVQNNIDYVSKKTNGKVGYLHIPDMGVPGLNEFAKYFYPQLNKDALIVDVRGNGGGNVSPMIIERLLRPFTYATMANGQKEGSVNPTGMLLGPKVTLMDKYSASDGDLFPYRFQVLGLGKTVGTRSWGGVVGYSGSVPLIDGGSLITPSFAPFAKDGSGWVIEGKGVVPDIIVENDPAKLYKGQDDQLDKAIEVILEEMKTFKEKIPPIPPFPDKTGKK
jgi:tricorn protease